MRQSRRRGVEKSHTAVVVVVVVVSVEVFASCFGQVELTRRLRLPLHSWSLREML